MDTIQVVRLLDVLRVNSARNAPGVSPRSLIIKGEDFRNVEQVIMDGFVSPSFVAYSTTELIAEVPEPLRQAVIMDVKVLSGSFTLTERSLVEFTFGTRRKRHQGLCG
jgi:hypothetical protein